MDMQISRKVKLVFVTNNLEPENFKINNNKQTVTPNFTTYTLNLMGVSAASGHRTADRVERGVRFPNR